MIKEMSRLKQLAASGALAAFFFISGCRILSHFLPLLMGGVVNILLLWIGFSFIVHLCFMIYFALRFVKILDDKAD